MLDLLRHHPLMDADIGGDLGRAATGVVQGDDASVAFDVARLALFRWSGDGALDVGAGRLRSALQLFVERLFDDAGFLLLGVANLACLVYLFVVRPTFSTSRNSSDLEELAAFGLPRFFRSPRAWAASYSSASLICARASISRASAWVRWQAATTV
jgi:hypothetical protein